MKNKFNTKNAYTEEKHPWEKYIPPKANKIILGTFPTKIENRQFEFYYPNKNNRFWKVLGRIAKINLCDASSSEFDKEIAVSKRKQILDKLNIGITDIGSMVLRQKNSSLDNNLFPIEFENIFKIVEEHPSIDKIILTSSSKGNSVLTWFESYCNINDIQLEFDKKEKGFPKKTEIILLGKNIEVLIVCSTSGAAAKTEEYLVDLYQQVLKP